VVTCACNPSTQEAEESSVQGQPGLHSKILSQEEIKKQCIFGKPIGESICHHKHISRYICDEH
jgi:hypothetical protein